MKIKICGLKRIEDVDYVNQSLPDFIGFVFAGTKRKIDFETARVLKQRLKPEIKAVGVFVNADIPFIVRLVDAGILDMLQLHGDEDRTYIEKLRDALAEHGRERVPIIKAVRVQTSRQILKAEGLPVDFLLLDAFKADEYGGSGRLFNHKLIPKLEKPYILAGGITIKNVTGILEELSEQGKLPYGIDVSSSVESNGNKDKFKIEELIKTVNEIEKSDKIKEYM
ncbi:MAG: phosphoribosylanthranilate isomerase [Bacteroidales bacterium]|nr:phosphoribosylanthranilate isomerase [Clostridium sp.]MCM1203260.1 phosphoribosylanthranilate isomerase [Bacteroidales bacterium]